MQRGKFPISDEPRSAGLPKLDPGRTRNGEHSWLKRLGRVISTVKRQARTTAGGGGRRTRPVQSGLTISRRRVVVKVSYRRNRAKPNWAAHARYLTREHAQKEHERGIGFDAEHDRVDMVAIADGWQREGDPLVWSLIISPDDCHRIDPRQHVRELAAGMERDLGTKLEWTAIDHHPATENDHVHMLIRGVRDNGQELKLDRDYIRSGIRELSQSLIEQQLGPRQEHEMLIARERGIDRLQWTEIDRTLRQRQGPDRVISYDGYRPWSEAGQHRVRQEVERLDFLERIGLATRVGESSWQLSPDHERTLRQAQRDRDIIKRRAHERQHELERNLG
jgi:type IV secretory pathway VirD2 relaxase